jgi:hypothetical protein
MFLLYQVKSSIAECVFFIKGFNKLTECFTDRLLVDLATVEFFLNFFAPLGLISLDF